MATRTGNASIALATDVLINDTLSANFTPSTWSLDSIQINNVTSWATQLTLMLITALFPIYIASHAALTRPTSAARRKRPDKGTSKDDQDEEDDDEQDVNPDDLRSASDAIVLPIVAAIVLGSLYYALKYMENGIKKTLKGYFALTSIMATAALLGDMFRNVASFIFPSTYSIGSDTATFDSTLKQYILSTPQSPDRQKHITSPLPGRIRHIPLPAPLRSTINRLRSAALTKATITLHARWLGTAQFKATLLDTIALATSLAIALYQAFLPSPWQLTNLVAFGFAYFLIITVQQTAPATAKDTSLLLLAFLVYDLIMVFYTPLMIGVAKHLKDSPNMLAIPKGDGSMAQLGLGDVGLPGMLMAFALQFDLYVHYYKQQKPAEKEGEKATKAEYKPVTGGWGERFWTTKAARPEGLKAKSFPKPYFYATIVGYSIGLTVCMIILEVFKHGQPALIYLVPGVLGGLWGTAWVKGEMRLLWDYSVSDNKSTQTGSCPAKGPGKKVKPDLNLIPNPLVDNDADTYLPQPVEQDEKKADDEKTPDTTDKKAEIQAPETTDAVSEDNEKKTDDKSTPAEQVNDEKKDKEKSTGGKKEKASSEVALTPELQAIADQHLVYVAVKLPVSMKEQATTGP
ncbi:Intramembrane protease 2 [Cyphellophora attinorum]|uniref:Intramembrane protease 2 n=1 Tax=Cyphellophora attinorum TaxID=1664694 RepID=A0A0N1HBM7_9EURO|nr:Intramembrane protease 2 [Phialophora attinorum]KPI41763.1 Intramembrane protease 2 [Phialophora attinorum]